MDNKNEIENKIKNFLQNRSEINFAYIFGSFINNEKFNDIDIAVYLYPHVDLNSFVTYPFGYESEILGKLSLILKTDKIDLIVLNKANLLASIQVFNSGRLLFERDRFFRIRIENSTRKEFIDTEHYRRLKANYLERYLNVR